MGFTPSNGTKFYIGPSADESVDTQAEFEAFATGPSQWVEVKGITNLGEFGDAASDVTTSELGDNRVQHAKGTYDAGSPAIVANSKPNDAGQIAMRAALDQPFDYAFKAVFNDKLTAGGTGSTRYFRAKVMSAREGVGSANNPVSVTFNLGINSPTIRVAAS
jgi:hypothetical protein